MFVFYLILLCSAIYLLFKRKHSYWKRRSIAQVDPITFFGNIKDVILYNVPIENIVINTYKELKRRNEKHGGIYILYKPIWIPVDLSLIKRIMTTDYEYFDSHGMFHHDKDPMTINLFNVEGERWKSLRAKLTPTFTTKKLKMMFEAVNFFGGRLEDNLSKLVKNHQAVDLKETLACFGMDVAVTCFFGLESDCMNNPESEFRQMAKIVFNARYFKVFLEWLLNWDILILFRYSFSPKKFNKFFQQIVQDTIDHREENNITRKDYMELLLQLMNQGKAKDDELEIPEKEQESGFLTFDEVVANMILMFVAGYETTSGTTSFLLYELAKNQDIQERARAEIKKILGTRSNDQMTYEDLVEMKYCEKCITETLRMYPPAPLLPRICTKTYKVPGTEQVIEKGTTTYISPWAIQTDPEIFSDPWTFDPENFRSENKNPRPDFTFLAFGGGPRLCLGSRFAIMQIKIAMVRFLRPFKYTLNEKTPERLHFTTNYVSLQSKEELLLDVTPL